ncbi:phosphate ABC transporter substrate-binding protein PstS [Demequina muriae]|uniref:Phosphate-binding protein n=1 Tax=Demequina muriae TaxID=3051664 RepID=A0ABT8GFE5_9MICO|nr:phosphate ABC transporter substrate-binding protein PstS [Demequina sp. EGI L300058]MDN4480140.1 phosphate ABC transporter substrate-binding protein PstS [Demequina sp. EGI L300058]
MKIATRTGAIASAAVLTFALAACSPTNEETDTTDSAAPGGSESEAPVALSGSISGAGASSQEAAVASWRAGFQELNPEATVNYDPIGSGGGRTQFGEGAVSFAGSDALMDSDEYAAAVEACDGDSGAVHLPLYISPIAVVFNLEGVEQLNMTPALIAQIFKGDVTSWDDPAIAELNPDAELPGDAITPVYRADESGTTENFVDYLAAAAPEEWDYEVTGNWPVNVGESGPATSGQMQIVQDTPGSFAYVDASRAGSLGTVAVDVNGEFVPYSPEAAAAVVTASPLSEGANGENDLAYELDRTPDAAGAYPIVLVSYHIVCQQYDDENERALVTEYLKYIASAEGQEQSAAAAGSSPIGDELGARVTEILDTIAAG